MKRTKAKYFENGSIKIKTKKSLILRAHDVIEPLPDFVARPANRPSVPIVCESNQFLSGFLQILKKKLCFLYNYRIKSAKNAKILFPGDLGRAPNCH